MKVEKDLEAPYVQTLRRASLATDKVSLALGGAIDELSVLSEFYSQVSVAVVCIEKARQDIDRLRQEIEKVTRTPYPN